MTDLKKAPWAAAVVVVVCLVAIVGGALWMTPDRPTAAPTTPVARAVRYVNLGDSFAAGTGTMPLQPDSQFTCQRSSLDAATVLAARRHYRLTDVACAGATTTHLYESQYDGVGPQLDAVTADTDVVTLMIGGNDGSVYSSLMGDCAEYAADDPTGSPCRTHLGSDPITTVRDETGPAVERALRDIRSRAPRAEVLIVGYPWLVPAKRACRPAVRLADGDIAYVRRVEAGLNAAVAKAATAAGATFVDMAERSRGHDACARPGVRWIEPMVGGTSRIVMHPNAAGQRAIADAIDAALR
ncbi:lipase 2 [Gordonia spumicola]|uniref:Lipase 2 n=1 Tax=Gordonia spumicola TaxID=589161 RepID=A0A7I9V3R2_9ACTN|nr:SGNH/GDSL hydrolase family protein [Gordonia spumicola]GED99669.1 lipase 2 [Gordonia spumicola]